MSNPGATSVSMSVSTSPSALANLKPWPEHGLVLPDEDREALGREPLGVRHGIEPERRLARDGEQRRPIGDERSQPGARSQHQPAVVLGVSSLRLAPTSVAGVNIVLVLAWLAIVRTIGREHRRVSEGAGAGG